MSLPLPANLVGYLLINGLTFAVDLGVLTLLHGRLHWPGPAAIAGGYLTAFGLGFVLNRRWNFRSHAPVGRQAAVYAVAVVFRDATSQERAS